MSSHLDILQYFGDNDIEPYEHSLSNALELAKGSLPLVVVMQEPCNLADDVPYEEMVYGNELADMYTSERIGCPALQEVELLAKASGYKYSLKDFSVFDLNTLHSPNMQDNSDDLEGDLLAAHQTFSKMIKAKAPKVILVLTCKARTSKDTFVRRLWSSRKSAGRKDTIDFRSNSGYHYATVIRAFHPSVYLREDYTSGWSREEIRLANKVLRHCFEMAFDCLSEETHAKVDDEDLLQAWKTLVDTQEKMRSIGKDFEKRLTLQASLTK